MNFKKINGRILGKGGKSFALIYNVCTHIHEKPNSTLINIYCMYAL